MKKKIKFSSATPRMMKTILKSGHVILDDITNRPEEPDKFINEVTKTSKNMRFILTVADGNKHSLIRVDEVAAILVCAP